MPFLRRLRSLRYVPVILRMVWKTNPVYTALIITARVLRALVPLSALVVSKMIVDGVIAAARHQESASHVLVFVAIEFALVAFGEVLSRASAFESLLGEQFANHMSISVMCHAAALDLQQFESPSLFDKLERARRGTQNRIALLMQALGILEGGITLLSLSAALVLQNPWLLLLLAAAVLPNFLGETYFAELAYKVATRSTTESRELDYLRYTAASTETAKEVQLFGLAPWLIGRFRILSDRLHSINRALALRRARVTVALSLFASSAYYAAVVLTVLRAAAGDISVGTLTFLLGAFQRCRAALQGLLSSIGQVYEQSLYLADYFGFLQLSPTIVSPARPVRFPRRIRSGIVFDRVSFKYPDASTWALKDVSFELRQGERTALVGENGAGKTTITKLLARLYDPTEGAILLDGVDLRRYDLAGIRRAIGVIFQDFVRYDFRFDENIGIGQIETVHEYFDSQWLGGSAVAAQAPPSVITAAEKSRASSLLPLLPDGYRQMLGRRFESGVNLSGGQWQKVALARAYMRDSQVIVLDEPTAALDARAEYDVFLHFKELMVGRIGVVVSHRFSTVRMADRILVFHQGSLIEDGTHESLLTLEGTYAELFGMQAAGYR